MDCVRNLTIEKNVRIKYWKEIISTALHTLNRVQLNKDSNQTPYELCYGCKPYVSYLKVFGRKFYILKESRKGKFIVNSDEGIFLGYSYRRKAYKCLNLSTQKIIESTHVRIDEFTKKSKEESIKEPKDYIKLIFYQPDHILSNIMASQNTSPFKYPKSPEATELHLVQPKSQFKGPESLIVGLELDT